jgi:two-component system phosphate regulon sensor histidine kinase PhoR
MLRLNGHPWQDQPLSELTTNVELLKLFAPNAPTSGEVPLPDGRTMWASITAIPELGRVTVLRDISAFKALDKMKRDFVTAFTHDLRTPLATVKGYIELVRMDGPVTDRQEEDLVGITKAANLMKSLIEDLLELSRLERLEQLTREKIHLEASVQATMNSMKLLAKTKDIELVLDESQRDLVIEGNLVLLSRAVGNLLDNAVKYTPKGGQIHVKLGQSSGQALVSVIDNGPGIQARDLPRVFEKFYRARPELDDVPGTGLGLAIVKTIAEQHGGQVWVESQPNVGSTFTIALPLISNCEKN